MRGCTRWAAAGFYNKAVEVFTVNYDTLIEQAFERVGVPYFDGFIGSLQARFHPDLVDGTGKPGPESLPGNFIRLWKLHGSVNWTFVDDEGGKRVARLGAPNPELGMAAIYPSDEKYDASRRVPFVVLLDRFRRALLEPETILIVNGYSFGDDHLNEIIFDAALRRPRSEIVATCFGSPPDQLRDIARQQPNVTVLADHIAIVGSRELAWRPPPADLPGTWEHGKFVLGDFRYLGRFLSGTMGAGLTPQETQSA
jgi:hypothetical protein